MVVVIDYNTNNINSIVSKLNRSGINAIGSSNADDIKNADKLILPGVGYFASAIENLKNGGLIDVLREKVLIDKTPILGICLGMQLFGERSTEGNVEGLKFIDAKVIKFEINDTRIKIPHVGWNNIEICKSTPLLNGIERQKKFYFVHSYHYANAEKYIIAKTNYGYNFPSIIQANNIYGTQFHPEKSHLSGFKLIENFVHLV